MMNKNEAIEVVKRSLQPKSSLQEALGVLIPELRESEDERIRKALIELVRMVDKNPMGQIFGYGDIKYSDMIAWLEKQGEWKIIEGSDGGFDWVKYRNDAAKDVLCALINGNDGYHGDGENQIFVAQAVGIADELVRQFKEKEMESAMKNKLNENKKDKCLTCTNDKRCVTCENGELWEGRPVPINNTYYKTEGNIIYPDKSMLTWGPYYFHSETKAKEKMEGVLKDITAWCNGEDSTLNIEPTSVIRTGHLLLFRIRAWKDENTIEECKGTISVRTFTFEDECD